MDQATDRDRTTILVHYYRATVGRADVWRTRMDTATNWAIGATAGIVTFAVGDAAVPPYAVFIASLLTLCFLVLEARRLTFYDLWQRRVLLLEEALVRPAIAGAAEGPGAERLARELAPELGRTVPTMPIARAIARRLRRIYLYLFAVQIGIWGLKLANHPAPAASLGEVVPRAHVGPLSGAVVIGIVGACFVATAGLALVLGGARSESRSPD